MSDRSQELDQELPVAQDVLLSVERFLYRETRLLNEEQQRKWLLDMVDPDICYRVFSRQLRLRKDTQVSGPDRTYMFDESFSELDARIRQFETGMQWRVDPPERMRYFVTNIEAYEGHAPDELIVFSNCLAFRNRRVYEESQFVYGRRDILRRNKEGKLLLLSREVDYDQRYVEGRNLLFFL